MDKRRLAYGVGLAEVTFALALFLQGSDRTSAAALSMGLWALTWAASTRER